MVMVRFDETITEINGRIGNEIWRRDACMNHIEAYYYRHQHPTDKQRTNQAMFKMLHIYWVSIIPASMQAAWVVETIRHPYRNKKGEVISINPASYFFGYNRKRWSAGKYPRLWPVGYTPSQADIDLQDAFSLKWFKRFGPPLAP